MPEVKTLSGIVTQVTGSQVIFKAVSGATYAADVSHALLTRRYGSAIEFADILPGDKVKVTGRLWEDNSISGETLINMSLYPHNSTFMAKVVNLDPSSNIFTMQSKSFGLQTVHTGPLTIFKMNNTPSGLNELEPGMKVKVKAIWERNSQKLNAASVEATVRLVAIEFTGVLKSIAGTGLTLVGNGNAIYGVNAAQAKIVSKNNKPLTAGDLRLQDTLKVSGKHRSEDTKILASKIKDLSLNR